jgi:hypothetical protein
MGALTGRYAFVPSADEANPMTELYDGLAPVACRTNRPRDALQAWRLSRRSRKSLWLDVLESVHSRSCSRKKLHDYVLPVSVEIWLYCSQMHLTSHLCRSLSCPALSAVKISRPLPLIRPAAVMKGM